VTAAGRVLLAALPLLIGCGDDEPAATEAPPSTTDIVSASATDRTEAALDPLYQLLVSLLPGSCPTTTTTTTTASQVPTIEDLLDALGLETVPPPTCTAAPEATP